MSNVEFPNNKELRNLAVFVNIPGEHRLDLRQDHSRNGYDSLSTFLTAYRCSECFGNETLRADASRVLKQIMIDMNCNFGIIHGITSLALAGYPLAYSGEFWGSSNEWINNLDVTLFAKDPDRLSGATDNAVNLTSNSHLVWNEYSHRRHDSIWSGVHSYEEIMLAIYGGGNSQRAMHIRALDDTKNGLETFLKTYPRFYSTWMGYPLTCIYRDDQVFDTRVWNPFPIDRKAEHQIKITDPNDFASDIRNVLQVPRIIYFASHTTMMTEKPAKLGEDTLEILTDTVNQHLSTIKKSDALTASLKRRLVTVEGHAQKLDRYNLDEAFHLLGKARLNFWEKNNLPTATEHFRKTCVQVGLGDYLSLNG